MLRFKVGDKVTTKISKKKGIIEKCYPAISAYWVKSKDKSTIIPDAELRYESNTSDKCE